MAHSNELQFKDLKELNAMLKDKNKTKSKSKNNQTGGGATPMPWVDYNPGVQLNTQSANANNYGQMSAQGVGSPTAGYGWTAQTGGCGDKEKTKSKSKKNNQTGGGATPMPWVDYNPGIQLNTQSANANNYGQMSAQGVGSPTAGYGWTAQTGGAFNGAYGTNLPTMNPIREPGYNTYYGDLVGGGTEEIYDKKTLIDAVHDVTGDDKEAIKDTLKTICPNKKKFSDSDLQQVVEVHTDVAESGQKGGGCSMKAKSQTGGGCSMKAKSQTGGDEKYTRAMVIDAVADTNEDKKENVRRVIEDAYGPKTHFTEKELDDVVTLHMDDKNRRQHGGATYNASEANDYVSKKTGINKNDISMLDENKNYSEEELNQMIKNLTPFSNSQKKNNSKKQKGGSNQLKSDLTAVDRLSAGVESKVTKNDKSKNKNQTGGDATSMPWKWYNPDVPMGSQMIDYNTQNPQLLIPTSGPSGNSPNLIGGGDVKNVLDNSNVKLSSLGDKELVITEDNKNALFDALFDKYPELKTHCKTKNIFNEADNDDAYIWTEMQDYSMPDAVQHITDYTVNYFKNTYPNDKKGLDNLKSAFAKH